MAKAKNTKQVVDKKAAVTTTATSPVGKKKVATVVATPPTPVAVAPATTTSARRAKIPTNVSVWCRAKIAAPAITTEGLDAPSTPLSLLVVGTTDGDIIAVIENNNKTYTSVFAIRGAHSGSVRTLSLSTGPFSVGTGVTYNTTTIASANTNNNSDTISPDSMLATGGMDGSINVVPLLSYLEACQQPSITTTNSMDAATCSLMAQKPNVALRLTNTHHLPVTGLSFMAGGAASSALVASASLDGRVGVHRLCYPASAATASITPASSSSKNVTDTAINTPVSFVSLPPGNSRFVSVGFPLTSLYDPLVTANALAGSGIVSTPSSATFLSGCGGPIVLVAGTKIALVDVSALLLAEIRNEEKEAASIAPAAVDNSVSVTVVGGAVVASGSARSREIALADMPLRTKPPIVSNPAGIHFGVGSSLAEAHVSRFGGRCIFLSWFPTHDGTTTDLPVQILPSGFFCSGQMFVVDVPRSHVEKAAAHTVAEEEEGGGKGLHQATCVEVLMVSINNNNKPAATASPSAASPSPKGKKKKQQVVAEEKVVTAVSNKQEYVQFRMDDLARAVAAFKLPSTIVGAEAKCPVDTDGQHHPSLTASEGHVISATPADITTLVTKADTLRNATNQELLSRANIRASHSAAAAARKEEVDLAAEQEAEKQEALAAGSPTEQKERVEAIQARLVATSDELYSLADAVGEVVAPVGPVKPVSGAKRSREDNEEIAVAVGFKNLSEVEKATGVARAYLKHLKGESDALYRELAAKKASKGAGKNSTKVSSPKGKKH